MIFLIDAVDDRAQEQYINTYTHNPYDIPSVALPTGMSRGSLEEEVGRRVQ
jgi:hypothetical protein